MSKWYYHGTTVEGYKQIQKDGFIMPRTGNTYKDKIFLADNDAFARRVTFIKHAQTQGETIVCIKIHRDVLRKKLITDGSKHISKMLSFGDKTYCYSEPIPLYHEKVFVGSAPYVLNLPEGVSIVRNGKSTGLSFTKEAADKFGIKE